MKLFPRLAACTVASFALMAPTLAHASVSNDTPDQAIPLTSGSIVTPSSVDADPGLSPGEPMPSCAGISHTLWYSIVTPVPARLNVSSFGSKVDTVLAVYDGTLSEIACNDDDLDTGSMQSRVRTAVGAGTYLIQIGTYGAPAATGGKLRLSMDIESYLRGDDIADAFEIFADDSFTIDLDGYTSGPEDRECWAEGKTAWLKFTATEPGVLTVSTLGGEADTLLGMFDADLELLNCVDGFPGEVVSSRVDAGDVRYVVIDLWWSDITETIVDVTLSDPVAGDEPEDAIELPLRSEVEGTLQGSTGSAVDWNGCNAGDGRSVWYTATVDVAGDYMVDLIGDDHKHVAVFTSDPSTTYADACDGFPWLNLNAGQQVWIMVSDHYWDLANEPFIVEMQRATVLDAVVAGAIVREDGHTFVGAAAPVAGVWADVDPEHSRAWACVYAVLVQPCVER